MELATEATAFLSQVLGKSVAEQAAAGNAEGWKATAMLSSVKTYKDLLTILKFAATVNTTAGNEKMQAAYQKYGQVVADVGHMDDLARQAQGYVKITGEEGTVYLVLLILSPLVGSIIYSM